MNLLSGILLIVLGVLVIFLSHVQDKKLLNFLSWAEDNFKDQPETLKEIKKALEKYFYLYTNENM
jgi:hypothetical protein